MGIERETFNMHKDLEAAPLRIIHQEQTGTIVGAKVSRADMTAVAAVIGEGQMNAMINLRQWANQPAVLLEQARSAKVVGPSIRY